MTHGDIIFADKKISRNGSTEIFGPNNVKLLSSDAVKCRIYDNKNLQLHSGWSKYIDASQVNYSLFSVEEKSHLKSQTYGALNGRSDLWAFMKFILKWT